MIAQELQQSQIDNHARQAGYTGVNELFAEWNLTKIRSGNNPQAQAMLNQIENTWNSGNIQGAINSFKSFVQGGNNQIPSQTQVIGHQMNNMSNFNKQRYPYSSEAEYKQKLYSGDPQAREFNLQQLQGKIKNLYPT